MDDLGVLWFIPNRKRPVASTTVADSMVMENLVESGYDSFNKILTAMTDGTFILQPDIVTLCQEMIYRGYGDTVLNLTEHGNIAPLDS